MMEKNEEEIIKLSVETAANAAALIEKCSTDVDLSSQGHAILQDFLHDANRKSFKTEAENEPSGPSACENDAVQRECPSVLQCETDLSKEQFGRKGLPSTETNVVNQVPSSRAHDFPLQKTLPSELESELSSNCAQLCHETVTKSGVSLGRGKDPDRENGVSKDVKSTTQKRLPFINYEDADWDSVFDFESVEEESFNHNQSAENSNRALETAKVKRPGIIHRPYNEKYLPTEKEEEEEKQIYLSNPDQTDAPPTYNPSEGEKENLGSNMFDDFEFQNQLIAIVEELLLKRRLEEENENTVKLLLEEKYSVERKRDEQQRTHENEKVVLEELIAQLKKTSEDSLCISDDEKANQQSEVQALQQEIQAIKDEARLLQAEKINREKKVQELEGKLKLFSSFQESTVRQINDIRHHTKTLTQYCQDLCSMQDELKKNVYHARSMAAKYQISADHLSQIISILRKKNCALKSEIISLRTQMELQNDSVNTSRDLTSLENSEPLKGLHNVLALEEMLQKSQEEKKEILRNLVESSKLLNQYVTRVEESEKAKNDAVTELGEYKKKMQCLQRDLESSVKIREETERKYADATKKLTEK